MLSKFALLLWLGGLALGSIGVAARGATSITPVIIDVPSDGRAIVTVRNDGARAVLYQVTVMDWHVINGVDLHKPTQDFIASPPLFSLSPAASQVVRIGFRSPMRQPLEQAYRLMLVEVSRPDAEPVAGGVVNFAMQYLLPVFVAPSGGGAKPPLTWSLRTEGDAMVLRADNPGTSRTPLNMVGLRSQTGTNHAPEFVDHQRVTVLAHSWREWRFTVPGDQMGLPWGVVFEKSGVDGAVEVANAQMRPAAAR